MEEIRIPDAAKPCEWEDCKSPQQGVVYDRWDHKIKLVCDQHARRIVSQDNPEYVECCPNCGCTFGIN